MIAYNKDYPDIVRLIKAENDFLVAGHVNPDGDAVGSMAAMGYILAALGKRFNLYNPSGIPDNYVFLSMPSQVYTKLVELPGPSPKWYIFVDCGSMSRSGEELEEAVNPVDIINIDHHVANRGYGRFNWIDPEAAATGEMMAKLAKDLGLTLTGTLAEAVYLCIVLDTGHFSFASTKASTLMLAAELMEGGVKVGDFNDQVENSWSWGKYRLWLDILGDTRTYSEGRISVLRITKELMDRHKVQIQDSDGIINFAMRPASVQAALSMRMTESGLIKFSLRSKKNLDVQAVAAKFNGGGHRNAAAGVTAGSMDEVEASLVAALENVLGDLGRV